MSMAFTRNRVRESEWPSRSGIVALRYTSHHRGLVYPMHAQVEFDVNYRTLKRLLDY